MLFSRNNVFLIARIHFFSLIYNVYLAQFLAKIVSVVLIHAHHVKMACFYIIILAQIYVLIYTGGIHLK